MPVVASIKTEVKEYVEQNKDKLIPILLTGILFTVGKEATKYFIRELRGE